MEKLLSIIIPTYNMEAYLPQCLDSLVIPDIDKLDILVVNDGSTDGSLAVAQQYAAKYPGSIRVIDKPNGNYGSCINAALPVAAGKYVRIVDADDSMDTVHLQEFINILTTADEDLLLTPFVHVNPEGEVIKKYDFHKVHLPHNSKLDVSACMEEFKKRRVQMHSITYRLSVFDNLNYHQTEGISYTDTEWASVPMANVTSLRILDIPLTRYLVGREGQTMSGAQLQKCFSHLTTVLSAIVCRRDSLLNAPSYTFFEQQIWQVHYSIYNMALQNWSADVAAIIRDYDRGLKTTMRELYDDIGRLPYSPTEKFRLYGMMRAQNYPARLRIPMYVRVRIALRKIFSR